MTNVKILLVVLGTLGTYTLVAMSIPQVESEVPEELDFSGEVSAAELVAAGEGLFAGAGGCVACHGSGTRAPNLRTSEGGTGPIGARCQTRVEGQDCKEYLYASLVDPGAYLVDGYNAIMPDARRTLSNNQIWALVAFLQDQGGEVTVTAQDIQSTAEEGGSGDAGSDASGAGDGGAAAGGAAAGAPGGMDPVALMENNMCLNCHTLDDRGIELGPSFNGIGSRLTEAEIRTAILDPGAEASEGFEHLLGSMPPNFGETFTAAQLEAIVDYLAGRE